MVDEYQDTNRAQLHLIKELVARHGNLCAVGDDDQSIYAWRGADPSGILRFEDDFPGARVVVLDQNYRSTPTILDAANRVIANNTDRRGKQLWSDKRPGQRVIAVVTTEPVEEARFVAREIDRLCKQDGWRPSDIAVLYRSNIQTRELEEELRTLQIGYAMFGGQQFFERKEVKDLIAYLRVALSERDEISLRRIINFPARGIGPQTLEHLAGFARDHRCTLWAAVARAGDNPAIKGAALDALTGFAALIGQLRTALAGPIEPALRELIDAIDLHGDLRAASPSLTAAQRRIENVESLVRSLVAQQQRKPGPEALLEYLRMLSLASGDADDRSDEPGEKVVLTTLHGAKGLEFPVVFLVGAEEELLPHARALMPLASDVSDADHVSDVSEERRLAYVGITRAEQVLYVTRCAYRRRHGKMVPRTPSRFLLEIPDELLEHRDIAAEASAAVDPGELSAFFSSFGAD
jgi:superfamily I DNA/RNA helicase